MPTAAQQYVIIQEQMQQEAKLGKQPHSPQQVNMSGLVLVRDQSSPIPPNSASTTRFNSLKNSVSFSSYPLRSDDIASPIPPTVGGFQFINHGDGNPMKSDISMCSKLESNEKGSINGISSSASAAFSTNLPLSPHSRQVLHEKRRQSLTSEQIQALRAVENAEDTKRAEVKVKESKQRNELGEKIQKALLKLEKEELKLVEKRKALEEKNEIKALKKECRRELKFQKSKDSLDSSMKGVMVERLKYTETPLSTTSTTSFPTNSSFKNGSLAFASIVNTNSASNLSFSKKKRKSFSDRVGSMLAPPAEEKKKIEGPPFVFTPPKYISRNEDKEIVLQPMSFAPPPPPRSFACQKRITKAQNKDEGSNKTTIGDGAATPTQADEQHKTKVTSEIPQPNPKIKSEKNDSFFTFGSKKDKKDKKKKKNKNKQKDDMVVRGSLAASGNSKGGQMQVPLQSSLGDVTTDTNQQNSGAIVVNRDDNNTPEMVESCATAAIPSESVPKKKVSYYDWRSKLRQQQIYRRNNYVPSKKSCKWADHQRSDPVGIQTQSPPVAPSKAGVVNYHSNLTNVLYNSYYKPPKYISRHEERVVLDQPTEVTFAERQSKKKRAPSKWEAEDEEQRQALILFARSTRKETFLAEKEARSTLYAEFVAQAGAMISQESTISPQPTAEDKQDVPQAKIQATSLGETVNISPSAPSAKAPTIKNNQKKKKFWHMFSCSKRSAVRTVKNERSEPLQIPETTSDALRPK